MNDEAKVNYLAINVSVHPIHMFLDPVLVIFTP